MTWNCVALICKPFGAQRTRCALLGKYMSQHDVSLAAIQEPHFNSEAKSSRVRNVLCS